MVIINRRKKNKQLTEEYNYQIKKEYEQLKKRKITSTWEYW